MATLLHLPISHHLLDLFIIVRFGSFTLELRLRYSQLCRSRNFTLESRLRCNHTDL